MASSGFDDQHPVPYESQVSKKVVNSFNGRIRTPVWMIIAIAWVLVGDAGLSWGPKFALAGQANT